MKRIAVIEDNPDNRLLARAILQEMYAVFEYDNGPEALQAFNKEKPDLVLLDVSLPEMDGPEVLRHMRAQSALRGIPVIALTAHAMAGDRERYLAKGFDDYIPKPIVDEQNLISAIERLLAGK